MGRPIIRLKVPTTVAVPTAGHPSDPAGENEPGGATRRRWWALIDLRIGVVPAPIFVLLIAVLAAFSFSGKAPPDLMLNIAIMSVGGFACAELGRRLPVVGQMGAGAILATFVPSFLVYAHLLPKPLIGSVTAFTKSSNVLYLFISAIIVGSILGMDRRTLIAGFLKIFVPIFVGTIVAVLVGMGVATLLGLEPRHAFFFIVAPIMAGGVGEGAIPLSVGYASLSHAVAPAGLLAQVLPSVMFGSLTAILLAGALDLAGRRWPGLTGNGALTVGERDEPLEGDDPREPFHPSPATIAAAGVTATALYLVGALAQSYLGWPGPVTMLFLAVVVKLGRLASPELEQGAFAVFQFFRTAVTYPLLFAIGVAMTPWDKLIVAFRFETIVTILATVLAMVATGFGVARFIGMYPVEVGIVAACRCGQGGTGDVAILTAANRMRLMPFAQIATRIGGALTVTLVLIAYARWGG